MPETQEKLKLDWETLPGGRWRAGKVAGLQPSVIQIGHLFRWIVDGSKPWSEVVATLPDAQLAAEQALKQLLSDALQPLL